MQTLTHTKIQHPHGHIPLAAVGFPFIFLQSKGPTEHTAEKCNNGAVKQQAGGFEISAQEPELCLREGEIRIACILETRW